MGSVPQEPSSLVSAVTVTTHFPNVANHNEHKINTKFYRLSGFSGYLGALFKVAQQRETS